MLVRIIKGIGIVLITLTVFNSCSKINKPSGQLSVHFLDTTLNYKLIGFEIKSDKINLIYYDNYPDGNKEVTQKIELDQIPKVKNKIYFVETLGDGPFLYWVDSEAIDLPAGILNPDFLKTDSNYIEITESNRRFTELKGKFQATMFVKYGDRWGPPGTRILVTGEFSARK